MRSAYTGRPGRLKRADVGAWLRVLEAKNPRTSGERLRQLAVDALRPVQLWTASNTNTPPGALDVLSRDSEDAVRWKRPPESRDTPSVAVIVLPRSARPGIQTGMTGPVAALDALDLETAALSAVIRTLTPGDLAATTNCPPWTLHELIVHIADSIWVGDQPLPDAPPHDRLRTAADYYRRPERDTDAYRQRNVEHAQTSAAAVSDATTRFDAEAAHTLDVLRRDDAARVVLIPRIGPMILAEWIVTRVIAVAAHALDVAITLDRPPWTTDEALRVTRPVLIDLLGCHPPDSPRWTGHGFLAAATGRRPISDPDRHELGELADRLPLLS